ncbi:hypothetical protein [Candidatus Nanohalobium constans]|uniref:Uncharacterized protein n=1 Tax=Candidatus Nanohalobium constans TaxID=2565781 RepID=A0A5Q0UEE5_9ARCH|nr:hypothetical protein [Candidatus Nanohalobium constans]QGA79933.1 hypothetical protein LC1Nh_0024 [Candidatus Nanohalobium constans]
MTELNLSSHYSRLSEEDPFTHLYESKNKEGEIATRLFWTDDSLKFVKHYDFNNCAEVLEINRDSEEVDFYTVGGPTMYDGEDVRESFEISINGAPPENAIEYLEQANGTVHAADSQEEVSQALEEVTDELREEIPPKSYLEN